MSNQKIWQPIHFDARWTEVNFERFDLIYPSWENRRKELNKNPEQYALFMDRLKRKQAIDTGIIEQLYDLGRGVTETFIAEGFAESFLQHGDTDIPHNQLMSYLKDNFAALDFIFDYVKEDRTLSVGYIKELHSLITQHQEYTEAKDQFGNHKKIKLLRGEFKLDPNNPERDGVLFEYCPPVQVGTEMDKLINIYNEELGSLHVLAKAAFLHHTFVQIHPFQDGNGRIARLLASLVLIKDGLFPLSIERNDRAKYINALEKADAGDYQSLVDVFSANQVTSIERALNWKPVEDITHLDIVVESLKKKLDDYRRDEVERKNYTIQQNMADVFDIIDEELKKSKSNLECTLGSSVTITNRSCKPGTDKSHYYYRQIVEFAKTYDYYANLLLDRCWAQLYFEIDTKQRYQLTFSLHHYGYDNGTFAIGAFLSKVVSNTEIDLEKIDIPLGLPPLTISAEKNVADLKSSVYQQIELSLVTALAYISGELS